MLVGMLGLHNELATDHARDSDQTGSEQTEGSRFRNNDLGGSGRHVADSLGELRRRRHDRLRG